MYITDRSIVRVVFNNEQNGILSTDASRISRDIVLRAMRKRLQEV